MRPGECRKQSQPLAEALLHFPHQSVVGRVPHGQLTRDAGVIRKGPATSHRGCGRTVRQVVVETHHLPVRAVSRITERHQNRMRNFALQIEEPLLRVLVGHAGRLHVNADRCRTRDRCGGQLHNREATLLAMLIDLAKKFEDYGVEAVNYTDIGRDGMMTGINIDATGSWRKALSRPGHCVGRPVQHGGHRGAVRGRKAKASKGVICGRSIYTGALDFTAAQAPATSCPEQKIRPLQAPRAPAPSRAATHATPPWRPASGWARRGRPGCGPARHSPCAAATRCTRRNDAKLPT